MHPSRIITFIVTMVFTMMMALAFSPPNEGAPLSRPVPSTPVRNVPVPSNVHAGGVDAALIRRTSLVKSMIMYALKVYNTDTNTARAQDVNNSAQVRRAPSVDPPYHGGAAISTIQRLKDRVLANILKAVKSIVIANFVMRALHIASTPLFAHGQSWFNLYRQSKVAAITCLLFHPKPPIAYWVMLYTLTSSFFFFSTMVILITLSLTALLVLVMCFAPADQSPTEPTAESTASMEDLEEVIFQRGQADDPLPSEYFSTISNQDHDDVQAEEPEDNQQLILHPNSIRDWLANIDIEVLDDDDEIPIAVSEAEQESDIFNSDVIPDEPYGVEETIVAPLIPNGTLGDGERAEVPTFKRYYPRLYVDTVDPDAWIADMLDSDDEDDDSVELAHCSYQTPQAPAPASLASIHEHEQYYTPGLVSEASFTLLNESNYTQDGGYSLQAHIHELEGQTGIMEEATATIQQTIDQPIPQTIQQTIDQPTPQTIPPSQARFGGRLVVIEHPDGFFGRIDCSLDLLDDLRNTFHTNPLPTSPLHATGTLNMALHHNTQTPAEQPHGREYQPTNPSIRPTAQGRVGGAVNVSGALPVNQPMAARSRSSPRHSYPSGPSLLPIFFPHRFVKTASGYVEKNKFGPIIEDP